MLNSSVSIDRKSTLDHAEKSDKKERKKADKELEYIFEEYVSQKMAREKSAEHKDRKFFQLQVKSRMDYESNFLADKIKGFFCEDAKLAKDRSDATSDLDMSLSRPIYMGVQETLLDASDECDTSEAVEKIRAIIVSMNAKGISKGDLLVSVEGMNGIKINVAMVRSRQHTDIFVSSDSTKALNLISNQANRIEGELKMSNQLQVRLSVLS